MAADPIRLEEDQLAQLADQIRQGHPCRFDEQEARWLHQFANSMQGDGGAHWRAILDFGGTLIQLKKAGIVAMAGAIVLALLGALWAGIRAALGGEA